jgi:hypothetical protein
MSEKVTPFYTQAALLDKYIHAEDPSSDSEMVKIILEILRTKKDLRSYFFRSEPSIPWARILWENDFFSTPPEPKKTEGGYSFIWWDAQYYLISIASQIPEIVINHIKTVSGHGGYLASAIKALCEISSEESEKVLPFILDWLQDTTKREFILDESISFMNVLIKGERWESALRLFAALSAPQPKEKNNIRTDPNILRDHLFGTKIEPANGFNILKDKDPESVIKILEKNLIEFLKHERKDIAQPQESYSSWWRNAIEDTDQDILDSYEDSTLCALRDTLITQAGLNKEHAEKSIIRYLISLYSILRRLGLYLLWTHGDMFFDLVSAELLKPENLDDIDIHHEYFMLLNHCFRLLSTADKKTLVNMILRGPDEDRVSKMADWVEKDHQVNREEYISKQKKAWIRDRLWMIMDCLDSKTKKILHGLVAEGGEPEHPAFLSWMSGMISIEDISPFPKEQLEDYSQDELYNFIRKWRPSPREDFGPERISYVGLASVIANLILANPQRYSSRLCDIALLRPEYPNAIINHWANSEYKGKIPWRNALNLCNGLVENPNLGDDAGVNIDDQTWVSVRMSITRLIEVGLDTKGRLIPKSLLPKARNILLRLVDDPDPSLLQDRPSEGWLGHNDYITAALNHVRPCAIRTLIKYALRKAQMEKKTSGKIALEKGVQDIFTRKVNSKLDSSRAVHSVFGQYLPYLYWLDKEWVGYNLDNIFPLEQDEENIWFFIASWDGYILNRFSQEIFSLLRSRYKQAIRYITDGYTPKSHLDFVGHFSIHLVLDYFLSEINQRLSPEQDSLIVEFANKTPPEVRSKIGWALWIVCKDNLKELSQFWPKAKLFWEWRTSEATISNHSPDFSLEMGEYSHLLNIAPPHETIKSLRHLLEGLLPYMQGSEYRNQLWNSTEKFLSNQVERDPINSIRFYRLMYEQKSHPPQWLYHSDEAKKIIEISAKIPESRADSLSLIDFLARWGDYKFRDIYNLYSA